jgi:hypothetical protein
VTAAGSEQGQACDHAGATNHFPASSRARSRLRWTSATSKGGTVASERSVERVG